MKLHLLINSNAGSNETQFKKKRKTKKKQNKLISACYEDTKQLYICVSLNH